MKKPTNKHFDEIFLRLKTIFVPYESHFVIQSDTTTKYNLIGSSGGANSKRFGGVAIRANHVSFYSCPEILKKGSQALRAQMQGTSTVSFTELDESVIAELISLTAERFKSYQKTGTF